MYFIFSPSHRLPREYLYNAVASAADDPSAVLTPDDTAYTFSTHQSMACDFLLAGSLFQGPET